MLFQTKNPPGTKDIFMHTGGVRGGAWFHAETQRRPAKEWHAPARRRNEGKKAAKGFAPLPHFAALREIAPPVQEPTRSFKKRVAAGRHINVPMIKRMSTFSHCPLTILSLFSHCSLTILSLFSHYFCCFTHSSLTLA